jgi:ABC-type sugar transport system ATPase subunit
MRTLRDRGVSLIWVTHHLEELFGLADSATVFRDGRHVGKVSIADSSVDSLVGMMFGVAAGEFGAPSTSAHATDGGTPEKKGYGEQVLRLKGVSRDTVLKDISLEVRRGEILGIAGLAGAGRTELARAIMGVDKVTSGSMHLRGEPVNARSSSAMYRRGLAMVPEDRKELGILGDLSIAENISISSLPGVSRFGFVVNRGAELAQAEEYRRALAIRTSGVKQRIRDLSGGNQQKAVVARCLSTKPDLLIFDEPTQGVDVSAKVEVHTLIRDFAARGGAAIVIASEIAELIELSHRVLVMKKGRIVGEVDEIPAALEQGHFESLKHQILSLSAGSEVA